jgi:hypothetical protein
MFSTREILNLLRDANPGVAITEDRVRHAIRRGEVPTPPSFAGRLLWSYADLALLAAALGLSAPTSGSAGTPS